MKWTSILCICILFAACDSSTSDTDTTANSVEAKEERNKQTVIESYNGMKQLNAEAMLKDIAPDAVDYGDGSMEPTKSADSVRASVSRWLSAMESVDMVDTTMMAEGDKVWVAGTFKGTYKEDAWGMPTKGKSFEIYDVDMFTFNDEGQITSHRSVQAPDLWFRQMDIPMPKQK